MEENGQAKNTRKSNAGAWLSGLFLAAAVVITIFTVRTCCPGAVQSAEGWLGLNEGGRTRQAFAALKDALAEGDGVAAAFAESYQVIAGGTP